MTTVNPDAVELGVPLAAWLAADCAFDCASPDSDELLQALSAADPHTRLDELEHLVGQVAAMASRTPLWLPLRLYAARVALRLLIQRREELQQPS